MFIQIGENIYAKDAIAAVKLTPTFSIQIFLKNFTDPRVWDSVEFNSHAQALEEMQRIFEILQRKA